MALSGNTFSDFGGGISDLFAAQADKTKGQGDLLEGQNYALAAQEAEQQAQYTKMSTGIQLAQQTRQVYQSIGKLQSDVAGSGFKMSGTGMDALASSAQQGALQHSVLQEQGLITEQGFEEQAQSFRTMEAAADMAAGAEKTAGLGAEIAGGISIAAGVASLFTGGVGPAPPAAPSNYDPNQLSGLY